jgi:hypothetical protein
MRFSTPSLRRSRYAGTRLFVARVRRRGDGAIDPAAPLRTTLYSGKTPQLGHFAAPAVFFCPAAAVSFVKTKENGAGPRGDPQPPARPAGHSNCSRAGRIL